MNNKFYSMLLGEFFQNIYRGMFLLVIGFKSYEETNSLLPLFAIYSFQYIANILIQAWAGKLIDRYGASKILVRASFLSTFLILTILLLKVYLIQIIALLFVVNFTRPFLRTSVITFIPSLVNDASLVKANVMFTINLQVGQILGMVLAGISISYVTWSSVLVIFLMLNIFSLIPFTMLAFRVEDSNSRSQSTTSNYLNSIKYITDNQALRLFFIASVLNLMLIAMFNLQIPVVVGKIFNGNGMWLTYIDSSFAVGAIFGGMFLSRKRSSVANNLYISVVSSALVLLMPWVMRMSNGHLVTLVVPGLFGITSSISSCRITSELQKIILVQHRGKVFALRFIFLSMLMLLTSSLTFIFSEFFKASNLVAIGVAILSVIVAQLMIIKREGGNFDGWARNDTHV